MRKKKKWNVNVQVSESKCIHTLKSCQNHTGVLSSWCMWMHGEFQYMFLSMECILLISWVRIHNSFQYFFFSVSFEYWWKSESSRSLIFSLRFSSRGYAPFIIWYISCIKPLETCFRSTKKDYISKKSCWRLRPTLGSSKWRN